jgi:16S rRNA (cytosine967-C5)-methyltransferase
LAKLSLGSRTGDLVNAVMRNLQRDIESLPKPSFKDRNKLVAVTFSHPEWMVKRWRKRFGEREAFALMQANNNRPSYYIRANNLRTKTKNFQLRMQKHGISFTVSDWLPGYFKVDSVAPFINEKWITKGFCVVQDVAAGFAPFLMDPKPGEKIIELCAAPGTKSIVMSDMMKTEGDILAVDISSERLQKLADAAVRCRAENIKIRRGDATDIKLYEADGVLVDAPCTGTGVLSKRADLRWRRQPEDLDYCTELQERLLKSAAGMVKTGGRLVYSTCSLEEEENMQQVLKFIGEHPNFELESLDEYLPEEALIEDEKAYQTFPHKQGCDGHFGVRMRRVE